MSLPLPAAMMSAPPPPSMVSLPAPPVMMLAPADPVMTEPVVRVGPIEVDVGLLQQCQGIGPGAAIDRGLGAVIRNGVVAGARADDVGPTATVDGIVAAARRDGVGGGRADHVQ